MISALVLPRYTLTPLKTVKIRNSRTGNRFESDRQFMYPQINYPCSQNTPGSLGRRLKRNWCRAIGWQISVLTFYSRILVVLFMYKIVYYLIEKKKKNTKFMNRNISTEFNVTSFVSFMNTYTHCAFIGVIHKVYDYKQTIISYRYRKRQNSFIGIIRRNYVLIMFSTLCTTIIDEIFFEALTMARLNSFRRI